VEKMLKNLKDPNDLLQEDILNIYYAGHLYLLDEEPDDAFYCFSLIKKNFLPAKYMLLYAVAASESEVNNLTENMIEDIYDFELRKSERGFLKGLEKLEVDFDDNKGHKHLSKFVHYKEIYNGINIYQNNRDSNNLIVGEKVPTGLESIWDIFNISKENVQKMIYRIQGKNILEKWLLENDNSLNLSSDELVLNDSKRWIIFNSLKNITSTQELEKLIGTILFEQEINQTFYINLIDFFYVSGKLDLLETILLKFYHFYISYHKKGIQNKVLKGGLKDSFKKFFMDFATFSSTILLGKTLSNLSIVSFLLMSVSGGIALSFAKGAFAELFIKFIDERNTSAKLSYPKFKEDFLFYIGKEKNNYEGNFYAKYPINSLGL